MYRITGVLAVVIGLHATLLKFLTFGPTNGKISEVNNCAEVWWRNLLYLNNFIWKPDQRVSER